MDLEKRSSDKAAQEVISQMAEAGLENVWDRLEKQLPQCGFGKSGVCCRICSMGPCRISKKRIEARASNSSSAAQMTNVNGTRVNMSNSTEASPKSHFLDPSDILAR